MNCDLEWVTIDDVEALWGQFVLELLGVEEQHRTESVENYEHFASETLDVWLWALDGGDGYWWCRVCQCRHIID